MMGAIWKVVGVVKGMVFEYPALRKNNLIYAPVVQRIERYFPKVEITGSNPVRGTVIVAQSVERLFVAQEVAGSSPVSHPVIK